MKSRSTGSTREASIEIRKKEKKKEVKKEKTPKHTANKPITRLIL